MTFLDSMKSRYTTKVYDENQKLSDETIEELKEILRLSPSSINSQPWKFYFVTDPDKKAELAEVSRNNKDRVIQAHGVVAFVRPTVDQFEAEMPDYFSEGAVNYYDNKKKPKGDDVVSEWIARQIYLSLGVFLSACAEMGVDSTPMEGIDAEGYDQVLGLEGHETIVAAAFGIRDKDDSNQPSIRPKTRRDQSDVIVEIKSKPLEN